MFPVGMCSVVRAEYIPRGRRQRHSALGEASTVSLCSLDNTTKFIRSLVSPTSFVFSSPEQKLQNHEQNQAVQQKLGGTPIILYVVAGGPGGWLAGWQG